VELQTEGETRIFIFFYNLQNARNKIWENIEFSMLGQLTRYLPSGSQTSIGGVWFFLIGNSQNAAKNAHFFHKSFMNLFMCEWVHSLVFFEYKDWVKR